MIKLLHPCRHTHEKACTIGFSSLAVQKTVFQRRAGARFGGPSPGDACSQQLQSSCPALFAPDCAQRAVPTACYQENSSSRTASTWFSSRFANVPVMNSEHSSATVLGSLPLPRAHVLYKPSFRRRFSTRSFCRAAASPTSSFQLSRVSLHLPELLEIQRASFNDFIRSGIPDLLSRSAPIRVTQDDRTVDLILNKKNFQLVTPAESPRECILKMKTYSCKLYVEAKIVYSTASGQTLHSTKGEWVLLGHLPMMTKRGHFIINGSPRVVVHQVVRSPGIYFQQVLEKREKKRIRYFGDIIPRKGVWLRLQITPKGKVEAKLKNGKKISADMLENCLHFLERYRDALASSLPLWSTETGCSSRSAWLEPLDSLSLEFEHAKQRREPALLESKPRTDSIDTLAFGKLLPIRWNGSSARTGGRAERNGSVHPFSPLKNRASVLQTQGARITNLASLPEESTLLHAYDKLYRPAEDKEREKMSEKVKKDSLPTSALSEKQYKLERCFQNLFDTFKDINRYDLSDLGREKINTKFGISVPEKQVTALDISTASDWLHRLTRGESSVDDIDHLQNRRIRTSGELLHTQFENGMDRLKRLLWKKLKEDVHLKLTGWGESDRVSQSGAGAPPSMGLALRGRNKKSNGSVSLSKWKLGQEVVRDRKGGKNEEDGISTVSSPLGGKVGSIPPPNSIWSNVPSPVSVSTVEKELPLTRVKELFSTKPLNGALRELFGSNPLSQYMDQTNPLAEITHKRRTSCLGIGGVSRESAGMVIRGIHPTHYGRICPIETPEGKNAGLVNSLALYAKANRNGFLETPYYKVTKGQVQRELGFTFFSAERESASHFNLAPSDLKESWSNMLPKDSVPVRVSDNLSDVFKKTDSYQVNCIGISPVQMISVATSLIPFLEHNDANRALMGSNMQRQAVPLMIPERAIVGTGFESLVLAESGHAVQSKSTGFVSYVSADRIQVESLRCVPQKERMEGGALPLPFPPLFPRSEREAMPSFKVRLRKWSTVQSTQVEHSSFKIHDEHEQRALPTLPKKGTPAHLNTSHVAHLEKSETLRSQAPCHAFKKQLQKGQERTVSWMSTHQRDSSWKALVNVRKLGGICENIFSFERVKSPHSAESLNRSHGERSASALHRGLLSQKTSSQDLFRRRFSFQRDVRGEISPQAELNDIARSTTRSQSVWFQNTLHQMSHEYTPSTHPITNFDRSNQETCLTQRALVNEGDWVQRGDVLTDCSASDQGELAVGKNVLVAYIPWEGYNFEDAIVISERLVKEHVYTSLHIERYDLNAQDVEDGVEWFTNQLPGIPKKDVAHLDELGLPKIGTFVKEGDILVGKMRHSTKSPITPYQRLVGDILDETNFAAQDYSFYVPKGVHARVIKHQIVKFFENPSRLLSETRQSPQLVHIFLGEKRGIQVGDKMSGRHGNKGVVSTILPRQDMPYLPDGSSIDIILNPLGVPSRMNVGQVYECLLGLAGTYLKQHFKVMPFDELYGVEASKSVVYLKLYQARLQSGQNWLFQVDFPGKTRVIDGRSGECFEEWVTVGKAYMLKLIHMVNEKIHARATGPYALVTQQPLRGRSQKGGQRLGEMEVWALEGFGAAYTLQELLTKKSDDMVGRKEISSSILPRPVSVLDMIQPFNQTKEKRSTLGQSEIFKVLICELQALCLDLGVYSLSSESLQRTFRTRVD